VDTPFTTEPVHFKKDLVPAEPWASTDELFERAPGCFSDCQRFQDQLSSRCVSSHDFLLPTLGPEMMERMSKFSASQKIIQELPIPTVPLFEKKDGSQTKCVVEHMRPPTLLQSATEPIAIV
jgi:hypothetical protein